MKQLKFARDIRFVFTLFSGICLFNCGSYAQDEAVWQDISLLNSAAINRPSDWVYLAAAISNSDTMDPAFSGGAEFTLENNAGALGVDFLRTKFIYEENLISQISYANSLVKNEHYLLSVGLGVGYQFLSSCYSLISLFPDGQLDPGFVPDVAKEWNNLRLNFGMFFNSRMFDLGASYIRYETLSQNQTNALYSKLSMLSSFTAQGAFRFFLGDVVVEPNAIFEFKKSDTAKQLGVLLEVSDRIWASYDNIDFSDLQSLSIGADIQGRFRLGYSYGFLKEMNSERLKIHELILALKLN